MHTNPKILDKVRNMVNDYYALAFVPAAEVAMEYVETQEHLRKPPTEGDWRRAEGA